MRILLVLLAALPTPVAQAATLRTMTTMHGPNVFLSDLFDDSGRNAGRLLGPGPVAGGRIVIEAPQLDAIAREYNVAWRSISSGDRAVLEWPGRPLPKESVLEAVRTALTAYGDSADFDVDIPDFVAPTIPAEALPVAVVSQFDWDKNTGRFTASLAVTGDAMTPVHMGLAGRVDEMTEAPVSVTRLLPETVIRNDDVRMARDRKALSQNGIAQSVERIIGMQLRRPVAAGMPVRLDDLVRPAMVQRGSVVWMELQSTDLSIAGPAVAMESGAAGDTIRIQPKSSSTLITARIVSPDVVQVVGQPTGRVNQTAHMR